MKKIIQNIIGDKTILKLFYLLLIFIFSYIAFSNSDKKYIFFLEYKIDKWIFTSASIASIFLTILTIFIRIFVNIVISMGLVLFFRREPIISFIIHWINRFLNIDIVANLSKTSSVGSINNEEVMLNSLKEVVNKHISMNEIEEALDILDEYGPDKIKNEVIMLRSHYIDAMKREITGVENSETITISLNMIKYSILRLANFCA